MRGELREVDGISEGDIGPRRSGQRGTDLVGLRSPADVSRDHRHAGPHGDERGAGEELAELLTRRRRDPAFGEYRQHPSTLEDTKRGAGGLEVAAVTVHRDAADQLAGGVNQ